MVYILTSLKLTIFNGDLALNSCVSSQTIFKKSLVISDHEDNHHVTSQTLVAFVFCAISSVPPADWTSTFFPLPRAVLVHTSLNEFLCTESKSLLTYSYLIPPRGFLVSLLLPQAAAGPSPLEMQSVYLALLFTGCWKGCSCVLERGEGVDML